MMGHRERLINGDEMGMFNRYSRKYQPGSAKPTKRAFSRRIRRQEKRKAKAGALRLEASLKQDERRAAWDSIAVLEREALDRLALPDDAAQDEVIQHVLKCVLVKAQSLALRKMMGETGEYAALMAIVAAETERQRGMAAGGADQR